MNRVEAINAIIKGHKIVHPDYCEGGHVFFDEIRKEIVFKTKTYADACVRTLDYESNYELYIEKPVKKKIEMVEYFDGDFIHKTTRTLFDNFPKGYTILSTFEIEV